MDLSPFSQGRARNFYQVFNYMRKRGIQTEVFDDLKSEESEDDKMIEVGTGRRLDFDHDAEIQITLDKMRDLLRQRHN